VAQTQNLILRIVAQRGEISGGELLEVIQKFDRSADAVRAATNRMVRAGLLAKSGRGRGNLRYTLGPKGQAIVEQFIARAVRWHIALASQVDWDGGWLAVTFSVPEEQRSKRDAFRACLAELGFGLLSSSVWISPFDYEAEIISLIEELDLGGQVMLLHCQSIWQPDVKDSQDLAYRVWDLATLETRYRHFNRRAEMLQASLEQIERGGEVDAQALFFEAMDLQGELIDIIFSEDPCLPIELLSPDWPGRRTHELMHAFTRSADRLDLADQRYEYLFHLIPGMELLEVFLPEGDTSLHWPEEEEGAG
jgi:phenylacetic acid degradation operon negative regulatory protein